MNFGTTEIILIVVAIFLLFGASRLPQLARSIGQSKKAFKEGMDDAERDGQIAENKRQQIPVNSAAPQVNQMTDEEIMAEMRRRAESRQS